MSKPATIASWILQVVAAGIFAQTLFFKFTAAPESVYIFSTLGIEPWGRIATAVAELVVCILILLPATAAIGALAGLGVIGGAIVSHLTRLGIVVMDDGGLLFALAVIIAVCCLAVVVMRRGELLAFLHALSSRRQAIHA